MGSFCVGCLTQLRESRIGCPALRLCTKFAAPLEEARLIKCSPLVAAGQSEYVFRCEWMDIEDLSKCFALGLAIAHREGEPVTCETVTD